MVVEFVVPEFAAADRALEDVGLRVVHLLFEVPVNGLVFQQKEAFYLVVDLVGTRLFEQFVVHFELFFEKFFEAL